MRLTELIGKIKNFSLIEFVSGIFLSVIAFLGALFVVSETRRKKAVSDKQEAEVKLIKLEEEKRVNETPIDSLVDEHNKSRKQRRH